MSAAIDREIRGVVTGVNDEGTSVIVSDGPPPGGAGRDPAPRLALIAEYSLRDCSWLILTAMVVARDLTPRYF